MLSGKITVTNSKTPHEKISLNYTQACREYQHYCKLGWKTGTEVLLSLKIYGTFHYGPPVDYRITDDDLDHQDVLSW